MGGNGLQPLVRFQDQQLVSRYLVYLDARYSYTWLLLSGCTRVIQQALLTCASGRLLSSMVYGGPQAGAAAAVRIDDLDEASLAVPPGAPPAAVISARNNTGDIGTNDFTVDANGLMKLKQPSLLIQYAQMQNWRVILPENLDLVTRLSTAGMVSHCIPTSLA